MQLRTVGALGGVVHANRTISPLCSTPVAGFLSSRNVQSKASADMPGDAERLREATSSTASTSFMDRLKQTMKQGKELMTDKVGSAE